MSETNGTGTDPIPPDTLEHMLDSLTVQVAYLHQTIMENSARPVDLAKRLENLETIVLTETDQIVLSTSALTTIIQTALSRVLRALPEGSRATGFIEVSPIWPSGALKGPKISLGALHIVGLTSHYRASDLKKWEARRRDGHQRNGTRLTSQPPMPRPIGTAIRLDTDKVILVREYYQRVLWLLYKARRACVANYSDKRDLKEFQIWASEHLGWDVPAWVHEYDDCNYVHPNELMAEAACESIDDEGHVTFSDGSSGIPSVHNKGNENDILFRRPKVKLNGTGDPIDI